MKALGVDLAWANAVKVNETGVVALDADGTITDAGWTRGVEHTVVWIGENATETTMLFVDAPLLVLNPSKQRRCEGDVGRHYGRMKVAANSTNLASEHLAGVQLRQALEADGWAYDDGSGGPPHHGRIVSECYPYTTIVGARELGYEHERPTYKRKPKRIPTTLWRPIRATTCDELLQRISALRHASPPMDLRSHPVTAQLLTEPSPLNDRAYKHREDLIDACLAAWTAALWVTSGLSRCRVLGEHDELVDELGRRATIIAPARLAG